MERPETIAGRNPILEALKSGRPLNKLLLAANIERHGVIGDILHQAREKGIPVEYVPRNALDRLCPGAAHQGIIAYAAVKDYVNLSDLLKVPQTRGEPAFFVALDGIEDPQNLGAILRTADAAGVHGIIIRSRRAAGLTAGVARASAGAVEYVPVARVANIVQALRELKRENIWVVGIDRTGQTDYTKIDFRPPTVIVIGSEGKGISSPVKNACDLVAYIPMRGSITSLNAATAAAVVMYEAVKQRGV